MPLALTHDQLQSRKDNAVRFVRETASDLERSAEIDGKILEHYAERRKITITNPFIRRIATMPSAKTKAEPEAEIANLQDENQGLQDQIDGIADIVSPDDEQDDTDEEEAEVDDEEDDAQDSKGWPRSTSGWRVFALNTRPHSPRLSQPGRHDLSHKSWAWSTRMIQARKRQCIRCRMSRRNVPAGHP